MLTMSYKIIATRVGQVRQMLTVLLSEHL